MEEPELSPSALSLPYAEDLFASFVREPRSVPDDWRRYFERLRAAPGTDGRTRAPPRAREMAALQDRVDQLVRAYRVRGHLVARLDPLGIERPPQPELAPEFYGFGPADLSIRFSANTIGGASSLTLSGILDRLRATYCRSIGVQFMHIDDLSVKNWLQHRMEGSENRLVLTRPEQLRILERLTAAVVFEEFLHVKYLGAKSFSLEGAESLIPLLDLAIEKAGDQGVEEIVIGMAHRGRLNVLRNIMGKGPRDIFREFDDPDPELHLGEGDVKYHLGRGTEWVTASGRTLSISLAFNPSHLEFVNPVVLGRLRSGMDRRSDLERKGGLAILIHGDAAFAGEGIVQETLNLSQLAPYSTGGTIHVILNNQIGFTTSPDESRSSTYATDVAKMLQIPIFHVNGEDPEAVAQVVRLALDFRHLYQRDVVIDMYGYRRHGHNEGDEPSFTQPILYRAIEGRKTTRQGYLEHLLKLGEVTREEADALVTEQRRILEEELERARSETYMLPESPPNRVWLRYYGGPEKFAEDVDTRVDEDRLRRLLHATTRLPPEFHPHPKIGRWLEARGRMADGERPLDWAAGEALAFATLATEGHRVRLTGQDSQRGTFSHRHAVLHDHENGAKHCPLEHLSPDQAPVEIANSPLSEAGVLGFEYGYSLGHPDALVVWEAQFGDFVNAAQVIVDQFLVSAEDKWNRFSGLVLLLPHGFEGMGPEHSSARLERWLQLCAEDDIQVVNVTTPAQLFHVLRRQVIRPWRKPLVVMSPKSLLRHPQATSTLAELSEGEFLRILPDGRREGAGATSRVLLVSGKLYYDLAHRREELGRDDVAILRVEQLYPLPEARIERALAPYEPGTDVVWVQEEPENMGAWRHLKERFCPQLLGRYPFSGIYREESASPATGSASAHRREQEMILEEAFRT